MSTNSITIQPDSGAMMYAQSIPVTTSRRLTSTLSPAYSVPITVASVLGELRIFRTLVTVPVFSLITAGSVSVGWVWDSLGVVLSPRFRFRLGSDSGAGALFLHPANRVVIIMQTSAKLKIFLSLWLQEKFMGLPHFHLISRHYYNGKWCALSIVSEFLNKIAKNCSENPY